MINLDNGPYKTDDVKQDACPTCGCQVSNKATRTPTGHHYRLECGSCSWSLPITQPQRVPIADGGTAAARPSSEEKTAQGILDDLHYDVSVAKLCQHLATGQSDLSGEDVRRALAKADGEICLAIEHPGKTEYITISDDYQEFISAIYRQGDATVTGPVTLEPGHLENRFGNPIDVCLLEDAPAIIGGSS